MRCCLTIGMAWTATQDPCFLPGVSGNPTGRPKSERGLLRTMFGDDGRVVFQRLEALRAHPKTSSKLRATIDFFIIERMFGRAQQHVDVDGGAGLLELLAAATARSEGSR